MTATQRSENISRIEGLAHRGEITRERADRILQHMQDMALPYHVAIVADPDNSIVAVAPTQERALAEIADRRCDRLGTAEANGGYVLAEGGIPRRFVLVRVEVCVGWHAGQRLRALPADFTYFSNPHSKGASATIVPVSDRISGL